MSTLRKAFRSNTHGIPWQAPATILASLLAGILLAIGHHLFYDSLHGQQARTESFRLLGSDVSPQQIVVAGGTALAFLVKAALITALSTAYLQLLWRALLRASNGSTLGDLDTAFSGLTNIFSLGKVWVWWRLPLLFSLAIVAWLLPLAAVVTPATLSIKTSEMIPPPSGPEVVPQLAFESLNFVDEMPPVANDDNSDTLRFEYTIPSREVIEVVKAVAATGFVLPITPPSPNATWSLTFDGPSLSCNDIPDDQVTQIISNIARATNTSSSCEAYGYLAWLEGLPFLNGTSDANEESEQGGYDFNSRIFQGTSMPATLYMIASPGAMRMEAHGAPPAACNQPIEDLYLPEEGAVALQCDLKSFAYKTAFNYTNGIQEVSVETTPLDESTINTIPSINCTVPDGADELCDFTPDILRTMSYQAIMDAVTYLITGFVNAEQNSTSPFISTQVISTALISTPELDFLTQPILQQDSTAGARTLQQNILSWGNTKDQGLVTTSSRAPSSGLAETIQQLFQNATVSMMSQEHLQPNTSAASQPLSVTVTHQTYHNVYTYSRTKLWIAYSVAIAFTAVSAILGLIAVAASGASYSSSSSFSSAVRVGRGAYLSTDLRNEDVDGRDPLPEHLAKAKVFPEHARTVQGSRVDSMLLSRRSRAESIALAERPKSRPTSSSASLLREPEGIGPPAKPWAGL